VDLDSSLFDEANICVRCKRCGKLLGKKLDNRIFISRKNITIVATLPITIECYQCKEVQEIN
jgi:ribosomal protein S27E